MELEKQDILEYFKDWKPVEKTVIPEFIAIFIEVNKRNGRSLYRAFEIASHLHREVNEWRLKNEEEFVKAWFGRYEIEQPKEKLYKVIIPNLIKKEGFCYWDSSLNIDYSNQYEIAFVRSRIFTEEEIKAIDERYWSFAVEIVQ
jgi:hypothetical protein